MSASVRVVHSSEDTLQFLPFFSCHRPSLPAWESETIQHRLFLLAYMYMHVHANAMHAHVHVAYLAERASVVSPDDKNKRL